MDDPSLTVVGRETPSGESYYRENRLYKGKWEQTQKNSFGIGDRPDYAKTRGPGVSPAAYGDVSKKMSAIKENITYTDVKLKPRFLSIGQKIASDPRHSGPGPAKYDTRYNAGDSGLSRGSKNPKWSIAARYQNNSKINEDGCKPGPGHYRTRSLPGKNYPITHGTLYDITLGCRFKNQDFVTQKVPGPGAYNV